MLNKAKQLWSDLARLLSTRSRRGDNTNPRICGLKEAVRRGFFNVETGELATGFKITAQDVVLDAGCGDGGAILFCARQGAHIVFSDVDEEKVKSVAGRASQTEARKVEGFVSDTMPLPVPDGYATKILFMEVLEHTENPEKILAELVRVGQAGARYLITVPDARSEMLQKKVADSILFSEPNHIQIFSKERFVRTVEDAGLKIEKYDTYGFFWSMFMLFFWVAQRHEGQALNGAVLDEIKPPYHRVLQNWSNTWSEFLDLDGSDLLTDVLDDYLPKTQMIIASKK